MNPIKTPVNTEGLHTPAFVVALGKCICEARKHPENTDDVKIVEDFKIAINLHQIGSPIRTYYDTMMANALMIAEGLKNKLRRRNALLEDLDKRKDEIERRVDKRDVFWDRIKTGRDLLLIGGFLFTAFSFMKSLPAIGPVLHGGNEGYAAVASALGSLLIWTTLRTRLDERRFSKASRYYRWMSNRIWRMYRLSIQREYHHALNSVNIAWKQMTGEDPQDAEISKLVLEALTREVEEIDQLNGDDLKELTLTDILMALGLWRVKSSKKGVSAPKAEEKK